MNNREIIELYQRMGIGSQQERDRLLHWTIDPESSVNKMQTFIIDSPNSKPMEAAEDAQLARDTE